MKKRAGRISLYNDVMQLDAELYMAGWKELGDIVPTAAGLAVTLGVSKASLYEWAKHHPRFSDTLDRLNVVQEQLLLSGSLGNKLNSNIAKLMLSNHGHREVKAVDMTSSDGSMTPSKAMDLSGLSDAAVAELMAARDKPNRD